jgi:hypothetical protein
VIHEDELNTCNKLKTRIANKRPHSQPPSRENKSKAYLELQKRRKSLEIEKAKFFSDLIEGSRYSFSFGDRTHRILQKETQKCLDTVLKAETSLRPIESVTTQEIKSPEPNKDLPSKGINSNESVTTATIRKDEPIISEKYNSKTNYNPVLSIREHEGDRRQSLCDNLSSDTVTTREQEIQDKTDVIDQNANVNATESRNQYTSAEVEILTKNDLIRNHEPNAQQVHIVEDDTKFNVADEENRFSHQGQDKCPVRIAVGRNC